MSFIIDHSIGIIVTALIVILIGVLITIFCGIGFGLFLIVAGIIMIVGVYKAKQKVITIYYNNK